jgi:hypothetical protein
MLCHPVEGPRQYQDLFPERDLFLKPETAGFRHKREDPLKDKESMTNLYQVDPDT